MKVSGHVPKAVVSQTKIQELNEFTKNRFDTIIMKMNDMHHVTTTLLTVTEKNQAEDKTAENTIQ